ncbi:MAG: YchJ family protein [Vampirovibrionales bacterium]
MMQSTDCPCQSGNPYTSCCEPFHTKRQLPDTPEQLMRSRYSAFALGLVTYIMETTHRQSESYVKATAFWREQLKRYCQQTEFLGLNILSAPEVTATSTEGYVHFIATLKLNPIEKPEQLTEQEEHSHFRKVSGRWLFC